MRIPDSPWLSLLDAQGKPLAAGLDRARGGRGQPRRLPERGGSSRVTDADQTQDDWTVLHATRPGTYRIAAPYKLPRGTTCPQETD